MGQSIDNFILAKTTAEKRLSNYKALVEEFKKSGNWLSGTYGIGTSDKAPLIDRSSKELLETYGDQAKFDKYMNDEVFNKRIAQLEDDISKAGFRAERKSMRISQNITDIEDITDEEFITLAKRNQELYNLKKSNPEEFIKIFNPDVTIPGTNEKLMYAIHSGAPELSGGALDPSFSIGSESAIAEAGGDTKGANRGKAAQFRETTNSLSEKSESKILRQRQLDIITDANTQAKIAAGQAYQESANFLSATSPSAGIHTGYFGRTNWGSGATHLSYARQKVTTEAAELAFDLDASTGGRGSMYLIRGVKDYTINTVGLNADHGETPLLGKHKPISGLSSTKEDAKPLTMANHMGGDIELDRNPTRIDLAWLEKQINEDVARVTSGHVPLDEIFGPAAAHAGIKGSTEITKSVPTVPKNIVSSTMEKAEQKIAAKVASNEIPKTIEEGVSVAVRRSGATESLLKAASHASSAVAAGTSNSAALRGAGAALSILRGVI